MIASGALAGITLTSEIISESLKNTFQHDPITVQRTVLTR